MDVHCTLYTVNCTGYADFTCTPSTLLRIGETPAWYESFSTPYLHMHIQRYRPWVSHVPPVPLDMRALYRVSSKGEGWGVKPQPGKWLSRGCHGYPSHCHITRRILPHYLRHKRFWGHGGEKPNKCNRCDFTSSQAGNLRMHLKTHTGVKSSGCHGYPSCPHITGQGRMEVKLP